MKAIINTYSYLIDIKDGKVKNKTIKGSLDKPDHQEHFEFEDNPQLLRKAEEVAKYNEQQIATAIRLEFKVATIKEKLMTTAPDE